MKPAPPVTRTRRSLTFPPCFCLWVRAYGSDGPAFDICGEAADRFENLTGDVLLRELEAEPVLDLGDDLHDRQRVKLGQATEQFCRGVDVSPGTGQSERLDDEVTYGVRGLGPSHVGGVFSGDGHTRT